MAGRRTRPRQQQLKAVENPKWQAKAAKLVPLFEKHPQLKQALRLFQGIPGTAYVSDVKSICGPSLQLLFDKGIIYRLPASNLCALTTPGKILLKRFTE